MTHPTLHLAAVNGQAVDTAEQPTFILTAAVVQDPLDWTVDEMFNFKGTYSVDGVVNATLPQDPTAPDEDEMDTGFGLKLVPAEKPDMGRGMTTPIFWYPGVGTNIAEEWSALERNLTSVPYPSDLEKSLAAKYAQACAGEAYTLTEEEIAHLASKLLSGRHVEHHDGVPMVVTDLETIRSQLQDVRVLGTILNGNDSSSAPQPSNLIFKDASGCTLKPLPSENGIVQYQILNNAAPVADKTNAATPLGYLI